MADLVGELRCSSGRFQNQCNPPTTTHRKLMVGSTNQAHWAMVPSPTLSNRCQPSTRRRIPKSQSTHSPTDHEIMTGHIQPSLPSPTLPAPRPSQTHIQAGPSLSSDSEKSLYSLLGHPHRLSVLPSPCRYSDPYINNKRTQIVEIPPHHLPG